MVTGTVERAGLVTVQTPQAFAADMFGEPMPDFLRRPMIRPWSRASALPCARWRAIRRTSSSPILATSSCARRSST